MHPVAHIQEPKSFLSRLGSACADTLVRSGSYLVTNLVTNRLGLVASIVYNATPQACLSKIFTASPIAFSSAQQIKNAIASFCNDTKILDTVASDPTINALNALFDKSGFQTAVACDALFHGIYGCFSDKKEKFTNFLITLASIMPILLHCCGPYTIPWGDPSLLNNQTKDSYIDNNMSLNFTTNFVQNLEAFALYKVIHHVATNIFKELGKIQITIDID